MVRRLVEQQQVRLLHEQPRQMRAHDPAAAHLSRRAVEIRFAKAEAAQDVLRLRFELIAAEFVETAVRCRGYSSRDRRDVTRPRTV